MKTALGRRRFTFLRGRSAERLALVWLMAKGYRPLARRYAAEGGEVDLIIRRGGTIAFVEVKARDTMAAAVEAIGAVKQRRFRRAARAWLVRHPRGRRPHASRRRGIPGAGTLAAPRPERLSARLTFRRRT